MPRRCRQHVRQRLLVHRTYIYRFDSANPGPPSFAAAADRARITDRTSNRLSEWQGFTPADRDQDRHLGGPGRRGGPAAAAAPPPCRPFGGSGGGKDPGARSCGLAGHVRPGLGRTERILLRPLHGSPSATWSPSCRPTPSTPWNLRNPAQPRPRSVRPDRLFGLSCTGIYTRLIGIGRQATRWAYRRTQSLAVPTSPTAAPTAWPTFRADSEPYQGPSSTRIFLLGPALTWWSFPLQLTRPVCGRAGGPRRGSPIPRTAAAGALVRESTTLCIQPKRIHHTSWTHDERSRDPGYSPFDVPYHRPDPVTISTAGAMANWPDYPAAAGVDLLRVKAERSVPR